MALLITGLSFAQAPRNWRLDWRRVGNTVIDAALASPAGGPVDRVWYSPDGSTLFARTLSGRVFETADLETWQPSTATPPAPEISDSTGIEFPESGSSLRIHSSPGASSLYALGRAVYSSDDRGKSWTNLTEYRGQSIVGGGLLDLAVSPRDPAEIAIAGRFGVWRSMDSGLSWTGGNDELPNLPIRRLLRAPGAGLSARAELYGMGAPVEVEWLPGRQAGWAPTSPDLILTQARTRLLAAQSLNQSLSKNDVQVASESGGFLYAGGSDGSLWSSPDQGQTWRSFRVPGAGPVESIFVIPGEPRLALASLAPGVIFRTMNGGLFWDDVTAGLRAGAVHGLTADLSTGAVYAATDEGLFYTLADLRAAAAPTPWIAIAGLPASRVNDVKLDAAGNQIFVALDGYGLYAAMAPHRFLDPRVVNAADYSQRPAAPGSLLSVLGLRVASARAGALDLPVLAATEAESQVQVPFEATGSSLLLALTLDGAARRDLLMVPLRATSPAIFVDRDGEPMVLDADRGVLLDPMTPAHAGGRIQILATGLGKVTPDWPTGLAAPLENPPRVSEPVQVFLDRIPVPVTRATLAPGYVGFYLIEVQLPSVVNAGPAELYIESGAQSSGRVSIHLAQ
ncbi:MAG: hypothetical protein JJE04_01025 [Acidobacteriia bacterium]|nr:hypothetical protein [Terriglobia bacterium]